MNLFMTTSVINIWVSWHPVEKLYKPSIPGACWPIQVIVDYATFSGCEFARIITTLEDTNKACQSIFCISGRYTCFASMEAHARSEYEECREVWNCSSYEHGSIVSVPSPPRPSKPFCEWIRANIQVCQRGRCCHYKGHTVPLNVRGRFYLSGNSSNASLLFRASNLVMIPY